MQTDAEREFYLGLSGRNVSEIDANYILEELQNEYY